MWTPEYFVRPLPFPLNVHALVQPNGDGSFDIYVNEYLSDARRARAIAHELEHIRRDHFYRDIELAQREAEAGGFVMLSPPPRSAAPERGLRELRVYESTAELLSLWLSLVTVQQKKRLWKAGSAARRLNP